MSDRWHILGVGSIGGLFAHRLNAGGANVRLLSRDFTESHRQLLLATDPAPAAHLFDCESVEDTAEIEHLLITTKSWGAYDAINRIQHRLTERTVVVAMMNGMQHVDDEEIDEMMATVDDNGESDGEIDFIEFCTLMKTFLGEELQDAFEARKGRSPSRLSPESQGAKNWGK